MSTALLHSPISPKAARAATAEDPSPTAVAAAAAERHRIARDLHDGPIQGLAAAALELDTVKRVLESGETATALELVSELRRRVAEEASELRRLMQGLRPSILEDRTLPEAVRALCERVAATHGLDIDVDARGCESVTSQAGELVYQIVHQALANVGAHAGARRVRVRLVQGASTLEAEVVDDGRGFDPSCADQFARRGRVGLASMRERAALVGATLWIWSRPQSGTRIRLRVPLSS